MTITQSFYSFLSADSGVTAITSRIHPGSVPQSEDFPAITFELTDDEPTLILDGFGSASLARMNVDCWDKSLVTAESIATAVKNALIGHYGTFGSNTVTNVVKTRELHLEENDTGLRRVSLQFDILYGA